MNSDVIDQVNELLTDRSQLKKESASEIISKLVSKRDNFKENFVLNFPFNYNDKEEFSNLSHRIETMNEGLGKLKCDNKEISSELKKTTEIQNSTEIENELKPLVLKSIYVKRQMAYIRCSIRIEELKKSIEINLLGLTAMKDDEIALSIKSKHLKTDKKTTDKPDQLDRQRSLKQKMLFEETILLYKQLRNLLESIDTSRCMNLLVHMTEVILSYHEQLKSLLVNKIEEKLKSISYPFVQNENDLSEKKNETGSDSQEKQSQQMKQENENILKFCIDCLLDIELNPLLTELTQNVNFPGKFNGKESNKTTVIEILAKPFETRFKFHFMGTRKTNNYQKPEWYLSQILKWIKYHEEFITSTIQPLFENYKMYKNRPVFIDFTNSLINLIKKKINKDLHVLMKNKFQFSHSVDELLLFDKQLKNNLHESSFFYDSQHVYGCLHILCENDLLFSNWISLERQVCQKKLDTMFVNLLPCGPQGSHGSNQEQNVLLNLNGDKQLDDVWACDYSDIDKMKPPHCAESFMSMINAITDRFNNLPYQSKKLQFVSLQIELINDFHLRICQIIRDEAKTPFGKIYLGALNAVNYIMNILDEWKNSKFYIQMHYLKLRYTQFTIKQKVEKKSLESNQVEPLTTNDEKSINTELDEDLEISKLFDQQFLNGESLFQNFHSLIDINGTLFDSVLSSYEKIRDEMMLTVISNCLWEIKTRSRDYRREKWISMPLFTDYYKVTLTQSAADMLISLKNLLFLLKDTLAHVLFDTILKKITLELDKFLYEEILLKNQFNEGGISQFDHDFNKYFLPILNEFLVDSKSETYFRKTKEAMILLQLKQGSSMLIKEIIYTALYTLEASREDKKASIYKARNALKEFGVVLLTCEAAEKILKLRLY